MRPDGLVPPWIEPDPRSPADRAANDRVRRTSILLQRVVDERMKVVFAKMTDAGGDASAAQPDAEQVAIDAAMRRGNREEVTRLRAKREERDRAERLASIDAAIAAAPAEDVDPEYVTLWKSIHEAPPTAMDEIDADDDGVPLTKDAAVRARFDAAQAERDRRQDRQREMLGALPRANGRPTAASIAWWADVGATAEERVLTLNVSQRSPAVTLPTVVRWLGARSKDLRFDVEPGGEWIEESSARKATTKPTTREARE